MATIPTLGATGTVRAALSDLGESPDAIARALHAAGITGRRESQYCCPIANYLHTRVACGVEVNEAKIFADLPDGNSAHLFTPPAVVEFIIRFDTGSYPYLDADEADPPEVDADPLLDVGGYLSCGCHGSQREHTCGPLD